MILKKVYYSFFLMIGIACSSCNQSTNTKTDAVNTTFAPTSVPAPPAFSAGSLTLKTFEVKDTLSSKSLGWGYDIYIDGQRTIHQPILPGVSGTAAFSSEKKAEITGNYVIAQMMKAGTFVAISEKELDSLGILKK
jgi:Domain of unknown function (DUF4907)